MVDFDLCMQKIKEIENEYPVHLWKINDINIWPLLRVGIIETKSQDGCRSIVPKKNNSIVRKLYKYIRSFLASEINFFYNNISDAIHNTNKFSDCDVLFLSYSMYRTFFSENGIWDVHVMPLVKKLEENGVLFKYKLLEIDTDNAFKQPRYGNSYYINKDIYHIAIKVRLKKYLMSNLVKNIYLPQYDDVMELLRKNGFSNEVGNTREELIKIVLNMEEYVKYFERILKRTNAKIGVGVCYYTPLGFAFNIACKNCGIVSADLQHGIIFDTHVAYADWDIKKENYKELPEFFFTWWGFSKDVINSWGINRAVSIGFPWYELWKNDDDFRKKYISKVSDKISKKCDVHILYSMQTGINIPSEVLDVINNSPDNWQWWIRLHPSMFSRMDCIADSLLAKLHKSNIEIKYATRLPLYALLNFMSVHITVSSSVYVECAMVGIPSLCFQEYNIPKELKRKKLIKIIKPSEISVEVIKKQILIKDSISYEKDSCIEFFSKYLKS